jgi:hypothetical protein
MQLILISLASAKDLIIKNSNFWHVKLSYEDSKLTAYYTYRFDYIMITQEPTPEITLYFYDKSTNEDYNSFTISLDENEMETINTNFSVDLADEDDGTRFPNNNMNFRLRTLHFETKYNNHYLEFSEVVKQISLGEDETSFVKLGSNKIDIDKANQCSKEILFAVINEYLKFAEANESLVRITTHKGWKLAKPELLKKKICNQFGPEYKLGYTYIFPKGFRESMCGREEDGAMSLLKRGISAENVRFTKSGSDVTDLSDQPLARTYSTGDLTTTRLKLLRKH